MRRNAWLLVLIVLWAASCALESQVKMKIEIPAPPSVHLDPSQEIVLANFRMEKEAKEFDLPKSLTAYWKDEIAQTFKGRVSMADVVWQGTDQLNNKDFWKAALAEPKNRVLLTGLAQFGAEVRKALQGNQKGLKDSPFQPEKAWAERRNFSLKLDVVLISPETGDILFRNTYEESQNYDNMKQTAEFAFYDLVQKIRLRLFRALFGSEKVEQRYLLIR
jgi:hypothetical protein